MPILSRPIPAFPLEILERIVDCHAEHGKEERDPTSLAKSLRTKHSQTLLACHMVSKQFRSCALRHICRNVSIALYDTSHRLQLTQHTIFGEANTTLGSLVPLVKEVTISIVSTPTPVYKPQLPPGLHKDALIRLLIACAERTAIRKLSLVANLGNVGPRFELDWMSLPSDILEVFKSLLKLPSVSSLCLRDVVNLPAPLLEMANAHLHTLKVIHCVSMEDVSFSSDGMQPSMGSSVVPLFQFPLGFTQDGLQIVQVVSGVVCEYNTSWGVIGPASDTLKHLSIRDSEEMCDLPPEYCKKLTISSFPQLESFSYSYNCSGFSTMFTTLHDVVRFFDVSQLMPNLRAIELFLYLDESVAITQETVDWMVENDSHWRALDRSLSRKLFSGLEKVFIHIDL
ncbi:hypothetical protein D9619_000314 [Psilocybe cf. subviscida]|uniref:Uncharacterized protein n=1 Tax=Psilocybe cf. subviscida TaxID=2480587 RepID=A0A8H5F3U0_9AGAR|nr:hypothetical protein D9619_000314 [Psilocybe cf. subviscida]